MLFSSHVRFLALEVSQVPGMVLAAIWPLLQATVRASSESEC